MLRGRHQSRLMRASLTVLVAAVTIAGSAHLFAGDARAAQLDGAGTISGAPALPIGTEVTGGAQLSDVCCDSWYQHENTAGVQYWRVPLAFGDLLVIDYGVVTGDDVTLCLLDPKVTDYTLTDAHCAATDSTQQKHEFKFTAPAAGAWTLVVGDYHCCSDTTWAYQLTAHVKQRTQTNLAAPPLAARNSNVTMSGHVSGVTGGQVAVQYKPLAGGPWTTVGVSRLTAHGTFSVRTRFKKAGSYRARAAYPGDASHLPSAATTVIKVA
jgi:hypothetical protein